MFYETGTGDNVGWAFMFGITAILGAWGAGTLGQSDWTRYANRRFAPTLSQLVAAPITISVTATIGIIVTSAARDVLGGDILWNPIYLLAEVQEHYDSSSRVRAGVFFASLGLVSSQLAVWNLPNIRLQSMVTDLADFRGSELRVYRHGHGRPLSKVHQYHSRQLYHGYYRHRHAAMAVIEYGGQISQGS